MEDLNKQILELETALKNLLVEAEAFAKGLPAYSRSEPLKAARELMQKRSNEITQ